VESAPKTFCCGGPGKTEKKREYCSLLSKDNDGFEAQGGRPVGRGEDWNRSANGEGATAVGGRSSWMAQSTQERWKKSPSDGRRPPGGKWHWEKNVGGNGQS